MTRGALAALFAMILLVAACGGSDTGGSDDNATTATSTSAVTPMAASTATVAPTSTMPADPTPTQDTTVASTSPASASATVTTEPTATGTATAEPTATGAAPAEPKATTPIDPNLEQALVRLDDLPAGWTEWSQDEDDEDDDSTLCNAPGTLAEGPGVKAIGKAEASFQGGQLGPFLTQMLGRFDDDDNAERAMDATTELFSCETWVTTEDDGTETTWTFQEMSFPDVGDEVFARRGTSESEMFSLALDLVIVRDGETIMFVMNFGVMTVDTELTEQVVRTTLDRL